MNSVKDSQSLFTGPGERKTLFPYRTTGSLTVPDERPYIFSALKKSTALTEKKKKTVAL